VRELTRPGFSPIASLLDLVIGWAATVGVACWASGALGLAQQPLAAMSQGIPPQGAAPLAAAPLAQQPLAAAPLELIGMATLCYLALRLRQMLIWAILAYQRFAPAAVRRSCVFEPSCSEYMLRSLERHGLIAGLIRGFARLTRCHEPNGGVDEP
jgi:putative component of membrane protein insertase Oxa1/YidC/SpoIIIJ protein YidD